VNLLELTRSYYPSIGGYEKSIKDKTRIYDSLGIAYRIVTTDFNISGQEKNRLPNVVYMKQYTPYNITPSIVRHLRGEYDVVNINSIGRFFGDFAIRYFSKRGVKIILTPHSMYHTDRYAVAKRFLQTTIFPGLLERVHFLIAFSEYEKSLWVSKYGFDNERVVVIPHYVDEIILENTNNAFATDERYILYLGRNGGNKRPDLLVKAFLENKEIKSSLYLTVDKHSFEPSVVKAISNDKRIHCLGTVSEERKDQLLRNADAVAIPTEWEAFGYVAFEASQYSKPLLCSALPVFRELLDPKGTLFFENKISSVSAVLRHYERLDEKEIKTMGEVNHRNLSRYTFEQSTTKYRLLFERVQK